MDQFDVFLENVLLCKSHTMGKLTKEQQQYVKRVAQTENKTVKEYVKYVAAIATAEDERSFKKILWTIPNIYGNYEILVDLLKPLFILFKPKLSEVLECSHVFCSNNCSLYRSGPVSTWPQRNPELFDTDVYFFTRVLDKFLTYITVDVDLYFLEEVTNHNQVEVEHDHAEKLKQLYSMVHHYNNL